MSVATDKAKRVEPGRSSVFARGVAFLTAGTFLAFLVSVVSAPITSRLFPPEAFGVAAFFLSFSTILGPVAGLRYDKAIVLPESDREASAIFYLSIVWVVIFSVLLWFPVKYFCEPFLPKFNAESLGGVLWWFPASVFLFAIMTPFQEWLTRMTEYKRLAGSRFVKQASVSSFTIGGGLIATPSALMLSGLRLASQAATPIYLLIQVAKNPPKMTADSPKAMMAMLRRHWKFPAFSVGDSLLESISREAPVLLLALFFEASVVGNYSRAALLVSIPFSVLGMALEQVFYQQASSMHVAGQAVGAFAKRVFDFVLKYAMLPFLALSVIGPDFFQIFLGGAWREAGVYAAIIAPFLFAKLLVIPIATVYNVYEKQGVGVIFTGALFTVQVAALLLSGMYGTPRISLATYALGGTLVMVILAIWVFRIVKVSLWSVARTSIWVLLQSAAVCIPAFIAKYILGLEGYIVIIVMAAMIASYYTATLRRDTASKDFIRSILKRG